MHASVQCGQARPVRPRHRSGSKTPPSRTRRELKKCYPCPHGVLRCAPPPTATAPLPRLHLRLLVPATAFASTALPPTAAGFRGPADALAYYKKTTLNKRTKVYFLQNCHGCASPEACCTMALLCVWIYLMTFSVSSGVRLRFGIRTALYRA